jgi:hypothetical protein
MPWIGLRSSPFKSEWKRSVAEYWVKEYSHWKIWKDFNSPWIDFAPGFWDKGHTSNFPRLSAVGLLNCTRNTLNLIHRKVGLAYRAQEITNYPDRPISRICPKMDTLYILGNYQHACKLRVIHVLSHLWPLLSLYIFVQSYRANMQLYLVHPLSRNFLSSFLILRGLIPSSWNRKKFTLQVLDLLKRLRLISETPLDPLYLSYRSLHRVPAVRARSKTI